MFVVATAGHVDHGKSTLVKTLTGMEPDRWQEEKDRGLTIDLGFVWTESTTGREIAFVDVPGHERFLGNMLAGIGPAPVVCFVVAADEGWQAQSTDHRDAVAALGIRDGLVALTRADRADRARRDEVTAQVRAKLAGTPLANAPVVEVSAHTGEGLDTMRAVLDEVLSRAPAPDPGKRVRLWVDRSFSIRGSGTVVTGTLAAGELHTGQWLVLLGRDGIREREVRGIHSQNLAQEKIGPVNRVAVNLRGEDADRIHRGDVLITPGAWQQTSVIDVRRTMGATLSQAPRTLVIHIGTVAVEAQLRSFDEEHARLTLDRSLPLEVGDRFVLRGSGSRSVLAGVAVLDVDPPELGRRGDGPRRAATLSGMSPAGDVHAEVTRRGMIRRADLVRFGIDLPELPPAGVTVLGDWWIAGDLPAVWCTRLRDAVARLDPLSRGLSRKAARDLLGCPPELLGVVVREAGLVDRAGLITEAKRRIDLGSAEEAIRTIEGWLAEEPFVAPDANELAELKLSARQLAAAETAGRIIRLGESVLLPDAPQRAAEILRGLGQPFTLSQARKALDTTRRVAVPLLEHLDQLGLTRRVDAGNRITL